MNSTQKQQVKELLSDFDIEMDRLRHKFHSIIKNYEAKRVEHLKEIISNLKSVN